MSYQQCTRFQTTLDYTIANISGMDQGINTLKTALATTIFPTFNENNLVNFGSLTAYNRPEDRRRCCAKRYSCKGVRSWHPTCRQDMADCTWSRTDQPDRRNSRHRDYNSAMYNVQGTLCCSQTRSNLQHTITITIIIIIISSSSSSSSNRLIVCPMQCNPMISAQFTLEMCAAV